MCQFQEGDYVIYSAHGIGQVVGFEERQVSETSVRLIVICFDKDKMILRLPVSRAQGLRPLSTNEEMKAALDLLMIPHKGRRLPWSKRCNDYDTKLKSGNPFLIAEVIRDLYEVNSKNKQTVSFAEKQFYDSAVQRLATELALIAHIGRDEAVERIQSNLKI